MTMEKNDRQEESFHSRLDEDISVHIFSASAAMVGVCLTVIGIFQIGRLQEIGSISDNVLAINALVFLTSCILAYVALRSRDNARRHFLERLADIIFIVGLCLMAIVCFLVAYELL